MARYAAIALIGKAICKLLKDACPMDQFPNADFLPYQASDFARQDLLTEGVSIYLYQLNVNAARRNMPPRLSPDGRRYRPSLPLDLHFMLTPWSADAEMQMRLLGWAMRMLEDTPVLPPGYLNAQDRDGNIFHPDETVELIYNPLNLQDMSILWENLKQTKALPSVTYVARMVLIDSDLELVEGPPVQIRSFDMAKGPG